MGSEMCIRDRGKYGPYWKCVNEDCRTIYHDFKKGPLFPIDRHGEPCERCNDGIMITKATKGDVKKALQAKVFLSCSNYPKCKNAIW